MSHELSQCEQAARSLERELQGHRRQWEKTMRKLEEHRLKVTDRGSVYAPQWEIS